MLVFSLLSAGERPWRIRVLVLGVSRVHENLARARRGSMLVGHRPRCMVPVLAHIAMDSLSLCDTGRSHLDLAAITFVPQWEHDT